MSIIRISHDLEWFFLLYFMALNSFRLLFHLLTVSHASRYLPESLLDQVSKVYHSFEPPVSLIVTPEPETANLTPFLHTLYNLKYPEIEILVVLNQSDEKLLEELIQEFSLVVFPEAYRIRLTTRPVRMIYASTLFTNLRVLLKEPGDRADALNAGINAARFPLYCSLSPAYFLQRDSLERAVRPFVEHTTVAVAGGGIRLANRSILDEGMLERVRLPRKPWLLWRVVESYSAYLLGRLGWLPLSSTLMGPGFMGVFQKETVIDAGGYRTGIVGEDAELVARLHRNLRSRKRRYVVAFIPEPYYWTCSPEGPIDLIRQCVQAQRAMTRSLWTAAPLMISGHGGVFGWFKLPLLWLSEGLEPWVELAGYLWMTWAYFHGLIAFASWVIFIALATGYGLQITLTALLIEEILHSYGNWIDLFVLILIGVLSNLGPRQIGLIFRLFGSFGGSRRIESAAPAAQHGSKPGVTVPRQS